MDKPLITGINIFSCRVMFAPSAGPFIQFL